MQPLVSIIIPVYNSERYVAETIASAIDQTWPNKEIILVDDGSIDNSLSVIRSFESANVKVFHQENKGASSARNQGLSEAQGDYIQFLDADDLLKKDKIELQLKAILNHPGTMAYGREVNFFDGEDKDISSAKCYLKTDYGNGADLLIDLFGGPPPKNAGGMIPQHSWLSPRSVIEVAGNWNPDLSVDDDGEFFCRVVLKSNGIKYVQDAICYYRRYKHQRSLSSQKSYLARVSSFNAIKLKQKHVGNSADTNVSFANQAMHLLCNVYPQHPELCKEIERFIEQMGGVSWLPYQEGPHKIARRIFGWKTVRLLSYYKNK